MNKITKKSFYSFLALYLVSSFVFLAFAAYWFFTSQLSMEMQNNYYKMSHIAQKVGSDIIEAKMMHKTYKLQSFEYANVALYDKEKFLLDGYVAKNVDFSKEFYMADGAFTLVSHKPHNYFGISYVVVQSSQCQRNVAKLKNKIAYTVLFTALFIIIIAVVLSYIFLRPIKEKMQEIEEFVKDTTHELNTPITALMMSTSRLKSKQVYDEKTINNITISTKQLYDIYESLSYISFDAKKEQSEQINFEEVVQTSLDYFAELMKKKNLTVALSLTPCHVEMAPTKAKMLINNLLSNAIKYSHQNSTITITTTSSSLVVKDEGIGIEASKLDDIFKRFVRANSYAGGFGVGLHIVESIVKEYGFEIEIDSQVDVGTEVKILCS